MADSDPPYFLDFLFNDIIDVHWGGGYLVLKTYAEESFGAMSSWQDLFFFNGDNFPDLQAVYSSDTGVLQALPGGTVRIAQSALIGSQVIKPSDINGTLSTGSRRKLKNSFVIGAQQATHNATLLFFIALSNFPGGSLRIDINTGAEQPIPYGVQMFSYKKDIQAGAQVSDFLPGKATGISDIVDGSTGGSFTLDLHTLKFTTH